MTSEAARELGVDVVSDGDLAVMAKAGLLWGELFQRFSLASGLVELSAVAVDRDPGEALVYCGWSNNSLARRGFLVLLRHDGDVWVPAYWQEVWIS